MALIITTALAALFKSAEVDAAKAATSSLSVVDALVAEGWTSQDLDKPKAGEVIGSSYHNLHTAIVNARVERAGITATDPRSIPALFYLVADRKAETIVALWDACRKANPKVLMTTGKVPKAKQSNPELQQIRTREHVAIGERIQFYRDALVKREGAAAAEALKQAGIAAGKSDDQIAAEAKAADEAKWEKQFVAAMTQWENRFSKATNARFVPLAKLVAECRKACEAQLAPAPAPAPARKMRKAK